jgi:hypothetical protein
MVGMAWTPKRCETRGEVSTFTFDQLDLVRQVAGVLLERGADHAAGPAPRRPQVYHHRDLGGLGDLAERSVVGVSDPGQRLTALAAPEPPIGVTALIVQAARGCVPNELMCALRACRHL